MIGQELDQFPAPWNKFIKNRRKITCMVLWMSYWIPRPKEICKWDLSPLLEDEVLFGWLIIINDKTDYYYWQEAVGPAERLATTSVLIGSLAHELRNPPQCCKRDAPVNG